MTRARLTFTIEVEYELDPKNYPDSDTDEARLAVDLEVSGNDPFAMIDTPAAEWKIEGCLLGEAPCS